MATKPNTAPVPAPVTTTEVETIAPKVTTQATNTGGDVTVQVQQGSTSQVIRAYVDPDAVFNEIPITTLEQLTDLSKQKFADLIVAGHNTDSAIAGFRTTLLRDMVKQAHKQLVTRVTEKTEKQARTFYKELRARGIDVHQAVKMSGYMPEEYVPPVIPTTETK